MLNYSIEKKRKGIMLYYDFTIFKGSLTIKIELEQEDLDNLIKNLKEVKEK